ncbi:hypothetical protein LXL04_024521 [Taraxacum kok-saghyz]
MATNYRTNKEERIRARRSETKKTTLNFEVPIIGANGVRLPVASHIPFPAESNGGDNIGANGVRLPVASHIPFPAESKVFTVVELDHLSLKHRKSSRRGPRGVEIRRCIAPATQICSDLNVNLNCTYSHGNLKCANFIVNLNCTHLHFYSDFNVNLKFTNFNVNLNCTDYYFCPYFNMNLNCTNFIVNLNCTDSHVNLDCTKFNIFVHQIQCFRHGYKWRERRHYNYFYKLGSFENSYIPENPRTPKQLTFSKNRIREAKYRSNTSPVAKNNFRKNNFFFKFLYLSVFETKQVNMHICKILVQMRTIIKFENGGTNLDKHFDESVVESREQVNELSSQESFKIELSIENEFLENIDYENRNSDENTPCRRPTKKEVQRRLLASIVGRQGACNDDINLDAHPPVFV